MSNLPIDPNYFEAARRITPIDESEGGAPLASLLNAAAQDAEAYASLSASVDLSAATAAAVKAASRGVTVNAGAARTYTLPVFADAPDGWTHTFIDIDANTSNTLIVVAAGADTINGVAGDITLNSNGEWCKVMKVPGATGWVAIGTGSGLVAA